MSARFGKLTVLFLELALFAAIPRPAAAQEAAAKTPDQPRVRAWTDRSGTHRMDAAVVELKDGKVALKKRDGTTIKVSLENLSEVDQEYVKQLVRDNDDVPDENAQPSKRSKQSAPPAKRGRSESSQATDLSVVEINPSASAETKLMSVVVTGAGTDPDKAKYNALSNAVEQTVGVLVDAETLVENDKLVRDKVLTYTEGDVTAIKILDQSQKDGLYYVHLKATVAVQKIEARLRSQHLAVREVDGNVFYDNAKRRQENAKNFTEMLANALHDFGAEKLVKPTIVGKPEVVGQNGQFATMLVKVGTQPDMENWKKLRADLLYVLRGSAQQRAIFVAQCEGHEDNDTGFYGYDFDNGTRERRSHIQGDEHGYWIAILQGYGEGKEAHSMRTQWTMHRVDKSVGPIFEDLKKHKYCLHVTLIGKANNVIAEDDRELKDPRLSSSYTSVYHKEDRLNNFDAYFLAPFLWGGVWPMSIEDHYCASMPAREFRISVPVNDLPDVARVTATIERIKEPQK